MQIFIVETTELIGKDKTELATQRYFSTLDKAQENANLFIKREGFDPMENISKEKGRLHLYSYNTNGALHGGYSSISITARELE